MILKQKAFQKLVQMMKLKENQEKKCHIEPMEAGYGHYRVIALSRYRLVHNAITRQRDNATTR